MVTKTGYNTCKNGFCEKTHMLHKKYLIDNNNKYINK